MDKNSENSETSLLLSVWVRVTLQNATIRVYISFLSTMNNSLQSINQ